MGLRMPQVMDCGSRQCRQRWVCFAKLLHSWTIVVRIARHLGARNAGNVGEEDGLLVDVTN